MNTYCSHFIVVCRFLLISGPAVETCVALWLITEWSLCITVLLIVLILCSLMPFVLYSFDSFVWEQVEGARDKDRETEEMQKVEITSLSMICMLQTLVYYSLETWLLLCLLCPRHSLCAGFPHGSLYSESGAQVTGS